MTTIPFDKNCQRTFRAQIKYWNEKTDTPRFSREHSFDNLKEEYFEHVEKVTLAIQVAQS